MKRSAIAAVCLVAALGLGGCGSSGSGGSGTGSTSPSSSRSASSSSSAAAQSGAVKVGDTVSLSSVSAKGVAAMNAAKTVKLTMTSSGETMNGEMSLGSARSYKLTGTTAGEDLTLIYVDQVLYLGGETFKSMNGGKPYIKIDPNGTDAFSTMMGPVIKTIEQASNPGQLFASIKGVDAKVVKIDGGNITYESRFTGDQMLKAAEKLLGSSVPSSTSTIGSMTLQQTFDKQGRPSLIVIKGSGEADTTVAYSDWGSPVSVSAPPASQVGTFDLSGMMPTPTP